MKIISITIHNFRSVKDAHFNLENYSVLIGANNQGKSNILRALRVFYECDKSKFNESDDFPKFPRIDRESWIEIEYKLTDDEYKNLKEEYRLPDNTLRVKKYLQSENRNLVKPNQSNIFAYTPNGLSDSLFYGAKNISQAKLGSALYIPDVMKTEDAFKTTGPSPFRNVLSFVMGKVVKKSKAYEALQDSFREFNEKFSSDASKDGYSLHELEESINEQLTDWEVKFHLDIRSINSDDIVKNLVDHSLSDNELDQQVHIRNYGQGLQRHLIYSLIKISTQYIDKDEPGKKEFNPDFTLILFEEPEAFLHPSQQEILNASLDSLSTNDGQQVLITTHSPTFVSKNIEAISSLIRVEKTDGITKLFQISSSAKEELIKNNDELYTFLTRKSEAADVPQEDQQALKRLLRETDENARYEQEAIRYLMWLDTERCCSFFSDNVCICEGPTEKRFIDYMIRNHWQEEFKNKKVYVFESGGKFHIHRFMNLFASLGISHSILYDQDLQGTGSSARSHKYINQFILDSKNPFTKKIDSFDQDIETFLGLSPSAIPSDKKPLYLMWKYKKGEIQQANIDNLKEKIKALI